MAIHHGRPICANINNAVPQSGINMSMPASTGHYEVLSPRSRRRQETKLPATIQVQ